jgi:hypothetical protein
MEDITMREITTEIDIKARPSHVWEILTDFDAYPAWNPFINRIIGEPRVGSHLDVTMTHPGGKPAHFTPKVVVVRANRELRWKGKLFVGGLFDGEHIFTIAPAGGSSVHFVQRERFRGILVPFLRKMLETKTRKGFVAMNKALKTRAEKK